MYRSYGGENLKGRPSFYSKLLALASFLQAAEGVDAEVVFLNDGPIPERVSALMAGRGEVVPLPGGPLGMRRSYAAAIELPKRRRWSDDDIVYFSEDDYLHVPSAFTSLAHAGDGLSDAAYFALYASTPQHPAFGPGVPFEAPKDWRPGRDSTVHGQRWTNVPSTASTFGARVGALRSDLGIFKQGMVPYRTRLLDHETCLVYQGHVPYPMDEVFRGPPTTRFRRGLSAVGVNAVLAPFRLAFDLRALTRRGSPHRLYAADPNLACHLETAFMSPGVDWADKARDAAAWATERGHRVEARGSGWK